MQRKRPRLSDELNTNSIVDISDDQSSDVSSDTADDEASPNGNDAPADDEESEDEDLGGLDDVAATQRVRERYEKNAHRENHAADNAIIEEIECRNFMCHAHLKIKVGPLINFIIGHNGSGKSAVLTALTICLGGKATATNRGQALKNFVKEGTDSASVTVRIKNQGHTAFRPDVYGRSIIVERHFSRGNGSGYKIKNEMGKMITTKKAELEEILDAFALQLDNPMNVLTQDMARQFLNSSSASEKYKFFLRGTHLEDLDRDYKLMAETLSINGQHVTGVEEDCTTRKREYEKAEEKLKIANRQQSLRDHYEKYSRQMAWAQVAEQEDHLKVLDDRLEKADEDIQRRKNKVENFENEVDEADRKVQEVDNETKDLEEEAEPHKANLEKEREDFKSNKDTLLELQAELRDLNQQMQSSDAKSKNLKESIEEERRKLANANDGQHAQRLEEIQEAKEAAEQAKVRLEEHKSGYREMNDALRQTEDRLRSLRPEKIDKEKEVEDARASLDQLQGGTRDWINSYHKSIRQLMRLIDQETRFREKPVGPLGRHVTLLKPQWSSILEQSFGASLDGFAVTSRQDQAILSDLMKRADYHGRIFIGNAAPLDTSRHEPNPSFLTWMRTLKIDNDLVRNQMIINQGIDQTVLIEDRNEAVEVQQQRPQNVKQIFSMHDNRHEDGGIRWGWSSTGAVSSAPIRGWGRNLPRMQANTRDRINIEQQRLDRLRSELHDTEKRAQQAQSQLNQAGQARERFNRVTKTMTEAAQRLETRVHELQDALEEDTPQTGTLDQLESDLEKEKEERKHMEDQYKLAVEEKTRINDEQRILKSKIDAIDHQVKEIEAMIAKNGRRKDRLKNEYDSLVLQKNEAVASVIDAERLKDELQSARQQQEDVVQNFIGQANQVCARVPVDQGETPNSLETKLKKLEEQIQRAEREVGGTPHDLQILYAQAKHVYKKAVRNLTMSKELESMLKKAMDERLKRWKIFRSLISLRAAGSFTYLLSERQFRGQLIFAHGRKSLDVKVSLTSCSFS